MLAITKTVIFEQRDESSVILCQLTQVDGHGTKHNTMAKEERKWEGSCNSYKIAIRL